jgi:hypothetical protein
MSEPEASQAAPTDDADKKPSAAKPRGSVPAPAAPVEKVPIWSQALAIAVIVTSASAWLLSDRQQDSGAEAKSSAPKGRAAPVAEEPEVVDPMAEPPEEAPASARASASADAPPPSRASASPREPAIERQEPSPE